MKKLIKRLVARVKGEVQELPTQDVQSSKSRTNDYIVEAVLMYDGNPVRKVSFSVPAKTSKHAIEKIERNMHFQITSTKQTKTKH